jgi:hypothetical protein
MAGWRVIAALLVAFGMYVSWMASPAMGQNAGEPSVIEDDRLTIESDNTDVEELRRLSRQVGRVPGTLLNTLVQRDRASARRAVANFLTRGNAEPKRMAARAIALINQVRTDPRVQTRGRTLELASLVSDMVARSVSSPRVIEVLVDGDYIPPANARAYDLGGEGDPVAIGFEKLTPAGEIATGHRETPFASDSLGPLLADGIANIRRISLPLANGTYRVILLTGRSAARNLPTAPFGETLTANSTRYYLGEARPATWIGGARLLRPVLAASNKAGRIGLSGLARELDEAPWLRPGGEAVGIAFKVDVVHGFLTVRFEQPVSGRGVDLSAIIVEPADQSSSLVHGREVVRAAMGQEFADTLSRQYDADPDMAAALAALGADMAPANASDIVTAALRSHPQAAKLIVTVVSRLDGVDARAIRAAIQDDPGLTRAARIAALAALPEGER